MKREEAKKIVDILSEADGGCPTCVSNLLGMFVEEFPEYEDLAKDKWKEQFEEHFGGWRG